MVLYFAMRSELVASDQSSLLEFRLLRPLGTTQRYRRSNDCCGSLLSCQATWCCSCWVCVWRIDSNRYSPLTLVNWLYDSYFDRIPLSMMSTRCSLTQSLLCGAPVQSFTGSNTLVLSFSLVEQFGCSLLAFLCYRLWAIRIDRLIQYNVGKASNTKCYIELMSISSCFV